MTVEAATFITELDETLPADTDVTNELDEHLRLVKAVLQNTMVGDGGTDIFSQALLPTLAEMNTWDARLTAMEAFPTTLFAPVAGHVNVPAGTTVVTSVTGIGFEPTQIIFCSTGDSSFPQNTMSFSSWTATTGDGQAHTFWQGVDDVGSQRSTAGISINKLEERGVTASWLTITNPNPDGFDVFPNITSVGTDLIYMAFP